MCGCTRLNAFFNLDKGRRVVHGLVASETTSAGCIRAYRQWRGRASVRRRSRGFFLVRRDNLFKHFHGAFPITGHVLGRFQISLDETQPFAAVRLQRGNRHCNRAIHKWRFSARDEMEAHLFHFGLEGKSTGAASMPPRMSAANLSWEPPSCSKVTSFEVLRPASSSMTRRISDDLPPRRLMPTFFPFNWDRSSIFSSVLPWCRRPGCPNCQVRPPARLAYSIARDRSARRKWHRCRRK